MHPDPSDVDASAPDLSGATSGSVPVPTSGNIRVDWSRRAGSTELELRADDAHDLDHLDDEPFAAVVATAQSLLAGIDRRGDEAVLAAAHPAGRRHVVPDRLAAALGMVARRELLQLRRVLPLPEDHPNRYGGPVPRTRAFRPGIDDAAWIRVNNRAFADHPDQGAETAGSLARQRGEDWFDPDGFLLLDDEGRPGELAGFCWTKLHAPTADEPELGEIYVIGVDPSHRGEHLGAPLVIAGLDHMAAKGITTAVLYVESDNEPARRLYDRLGFTVHERRLVYGR